MSKALDSLTAFTTANLAACHDPKLPGKAIPQLRAEAMRDMTNAIEDVMSDPQRIHQSYDPNIGCLQVTQALDYWDAHIAQIISAMLISEGVGGTTFDVIPRDGRACMVTAVIPMFDPEVMEAAAR
ncbi:hypothetical protein Xoosp14_245 [Xanthomonas phage Xoo-sp14]|nr:hypothetical protein Xoosp14_245 [Xanthomonas phage Xoo-sp14]